jgi:hypothetical protein
VFSPEEIQARLRDKPFRPLRIVVSEGQRFDIRHPDLVLVGRRDITVGIPGEEGSTIYDRQTRIAIVHVVALEDLPVSPPTTTNGET